MSDTYETADDIEARLNRLCSDTEDAAANLSDCSEEDSLMADPTISQHIIRMQKKQSSVVIDTLTGSFRCRFKPTQTVYVLHIPIYPPMKSVPKVETVCDQEHVVARTTQANKFGLRIELKRPSNSGDNESVIAEVTASST